MNRCSIPILISIFAVLSTTRAADCQQPRSEGDPSGNDIATALTSSNQLDEVCSGNFPPTNDTFNTFNHWSMIYTVSRDDASKPLDNCNDAFNDIISQCISGDNYWGGTWSLNGLTYSIYNSIYGQQSGNPLAPSDAGGPSSDNSQPGNDVATTTSAAAPSSSDDSQFGNAEATTTSAPTSSSDDSQFGNDQPTTTSTPTSSSDDSQFGNDQPTTTSAAAPSSSDDSQFGSDQATTTAAPVPGQTVVIQTDAAGETVTETFIPTTVSEYVTLTTPTTITTTTTSNGIPTPFPWIIGPGGVAFIPPPGVLLPPGVFPPPVFPPPFVPLGGEDGDDDPTRSSSETSATSQTTTTSTAACMNIVFGPPAGINDQVPYTPDWVRSYPYGSMPATTTTTQPSSTSTTLPAARTVTADGRVCVLLPGSVNPYCTPLSEPSSSTPPPPAPPAPTPNVYPGCDVSVEGFSCGRNCAGYVACPPWCAANCAYCFNVHNVC